MRKLLVAFAAILFFTGPLLAQKTVSGRVTDDTGQPVPNVSVQVKGTNVGTTTREDGSFTINVPANGTELEFTSIGKATQSVNISSGTTFNVTLTTATANLDEVIVVAYGTQKRSTFTGSAAQVNAKQFENRPLTNALNALVGAAPGVQTTTPSGAPGSSPGIIMRGLGSYSLSSAPLYVVDGAIYDAGFSNLNPDDIETITALKDASTTALYGSRGANGVIMITTKKGRKGRQNIMFKVQAGNSKPAIPQYNTVGTDDYFPLAWESYRNGLHFGPTGAPLDSAGMIASGTLPRYTSGPNVGRQIFRTGNFQDIYQVLGFYNPYNVGNTEIVGLDGRLNPNASLLYGDDLDWLDQATRTGKRNEYSVVYNSGNDKSDFSGSFNYLKEGGWGLRSKLSRFSGRVNVNLTPTQWFKTGFNIAGNRSKFDYSSTGGIVNAFYFARYIAPIYPVHMHEPGNGGYVLDAQGQKVYDFGNEGGFSRPYNTGRHTIAEHLWNKENEVRDVISARAYADVIFTPWLKFTTNISTDITNVDGISYQNPLVGDGYPSGRLSRESSKVSSYTFNQLVNFNKKFGLHNIDALVGHENYGYESAGIDGMRIGQSFDDLYVYQNFGTINSLTSSISEARTEGFLSRVNYDFDGKYLVSGSLRRDGNSKFPKRIRWENFWSIGAAWRIDKESFFNITWIDQLKLRASYGYTGNANGLVSYPYQSGYDIGYDDDTRPGVIIGSLGSPELTWETQKPLDLGLDFSFFRGRISGTLGYFDRRSSGLIFDVPQPYQNGGTPSEPFRISQNIGGMSNKGVEVQVSGVIVRGREVNWTMTLNATSYKNKITKMPDVPRTITSSPFRREEGKSVYEFFTRNYYGVDPNTGQALYLGVNAWNPATSMEISNGKGGMDTVTIDHNNAKQDYVGKSALPDVYGSLMNTISYKGFELNMVLTYQLGGYVYDGVYATLMSTATAGGTYHTDIFKRWQKPGDVTNVPRLDNTRTAQYGAASTRWLTDATYLSINNISLAYNLPKEVISRIGASGVRVFVSAENVHFFTKRKGMNVNGSFGGTTGDTYDAARVLNAGISLNF